jgi:hypothetical protein
VQLTVREEPKMKPNPPATQPLSVEGNRGFNVAGGIAELTLTFQPG